MAAIDYHYKTYITAYTKFYTVISHCLRLSLGG